MIILVVEETSTTRIILLFEFINIRDSVKKMYLDIYNKQIKIPEFISDSWDKQTFSGFSCLPRSLGSERSPRSSAPESLVSRHRDIQIVQFFPEFHFYF